MSQNNQFIEDYKKQILDRVLQDTKKDENDGVWENVSNDALEKEIVKRYNVQLKSSWGFIGTIIRTFMELTFTLVGMLTILIIGTGILVFVDSFEPQGSFLPIVSAILLSFGFYILIRFLLEDKPMVYLKELYIIIEWMTYGAYDRKIGNWFGHIKSKLFKLSKIEVLLLFIVILLLLIVLKIF